LLRILAVCCISAAPASYAVRRTSHPPVQAQDSPGKNMDVSVYRASFQTSNKKGEKLIT
jgi:hypothetical protein